MVRARLIDLKSITSSRPHIIYLIDYIKLLTWEFY